MSIRSKTTLAFFLVSIVVFGSSIWAISVQLLNEFHAIEMDRASENQAQVREAFQREITNMQVKVSDWSQWDDTYAFIQDLNVKYIESNLNTESLVQLKIHGIIYVQDGTVRHATVLDQETDEVASLSADLAARATSSALLSSLVRPESVKSEVAIINDHPVILSARGIFTSNGDGPTAGQIIFIKYVTPQVVEELRDTTKLDFTITPYTQSAMVGELGDEMERDRETNERDHIHIASESELESDIVVRDLSNDPVLYIKLHMPRSIHLQGLQTVRMLIGVGIFWGVSFVLLLLLLLDRLVLSRLETINTGIDAIGKRKDPASRLEGVGGRDELSVLVSSINEMLESLEQKGKELQAKNDDLESSKSAMLNILEDERDLEVALQHEKEGIERKVAERTKDLEGEKARLLASINSLNIGYILTDIHGSIIVSNDLIHTIFSLDGRLLSLPSIDDRLGASFDLMTRFQSCVSENKKIHEDNVVMGGSVLRIHLIPVSLNVSQTTDVIGAVVLVEDVTEQRVLERSKDEFFSIASHELRTPLTAIRGNSSLIQQYYQDALKDPSLAEMIHDMHESSVRLISIVNDFLDMSRLEMKKIEFVKTPFIMIELLKECVLEFQGVEHEQHVVVTIDPQVDASLRAVADRNKTKQVILNLLSNALKFTEHGTIMIGVRTDAAKQRIEVAVTDTGKGISEAGKRRLFHKFQQAQDNTLTRDMTRGTGLGLYISKLMVEGMGGEIWLEQSEVGKGSTFVFSLPLQIT